MVPMSVIGSSYFHDFQSDSPEAVSRLVYQKYANIKAAPLFAKLPSTLPYSFRATKADQGFYYLYTPKEMDKDTRLIIFLHGFGGCFQYYVHFMSKAFPKDVIVFPVYGYSGGLVTNAYLSDLWKDLKLRVPNAGTKPWMVGISAGGYSVFRMYADSPDNFAGGVCIASVCPRNILPKLKRDMRLLMINGTQEQGLPLKQLEAHAGWIGNRVENFQFHAMEGTHFFLFSKEKEVARAMTQFMD